MPYTLNNFQHQPQVIPDATADSDGLMSAADKAKLDGLVSSPDFLDQFFSGGFNGVPSALTEVLRFTPDATGFFDANITVEYLIFSHGGGDSTLRQTIVYSFIGGTLVEAGAGPAVEVGNGTVNSTVSVDGADIVISMSGSDETTINVFTVAKCRVSNG